MSLASALSCNQLTGAADIEIGEPACRGCADDAGGAGTSGLGAGGSAAGGGPSSGNGGLFGFGGDLGLAGFFGVGGTSGAGGASGSGGIGTGGTGTGGNGTGGSGTPPVECAAPGAACVTAADCCGGAFGGALCINQACLPTCAGDAACAPSCCLSWFTGDVFVGNACGDANICFDNVDMTPHGARCGGDLQCASGFCDPEFKVCFQDECSSSAECAPFAVCVNANGIYPACFPVCAGDPTCGNTGLVCADVINTEGSPDRACLPPIAFP